MKYRVLVERLAVCRLACDARIPAWALAGQFFCVVRTRDELSIVFPEDARPAEPCAGDRMPASAPVERGWLALKVEGPFPFSLTGVLASFVQPLAAAQIPIFAISTFDTDYVLIKRETLEQAVAALGAAGHEKLAEGDCE
ncbi:MAG: ACT domain-containing protein [Terriglobales bacterium]